MKNPLLRICVLSLVAAVFPAATLGQETRPMERPREGQFEITLKDTEHRKMRTEDELVRDRSLNPRALFRVKAGGYLGFDESEWVEKIEFKVFDKPLTELPEFRAFGGLLDDINAKLWSISSMLSSYDLVALRLMNICDRSRFSSLQAIDDNIAQQLLVYKKLELLKQLVVNSLNRFVRERSCRDPYVEYQKTLELYSRRLTELAENYEALYQRAMMLSQQVRPGTSREPAKPRWGGAPERQEETR